MRLIISVFVLIGILAGCAIVATVATVDFQPYEGKNSIYQGEGGTKVVHAGGGGLPGGSGLPGEESKNG